MLMIQLQVFDKFNEHPKYLLQYLVKSIDINYLHYTTIKCRDRKRNMMYVHNKPHILSLSHTHARAHTHRDSVFEF